MAYATINKPSDHFNTVLYTGDGTTNRTISGVGFQPDWTWLKRRGSIYSHGLLDSNRGVGKVLGSDNTDAEVTNTNVLSSWNSDGFVIALNGVSAFSNTNGETYVGWNWKANAGTTSSNTDGSITSTVQANTTAGFSIVTYTGNGTAGATIGHGLGKTPSVMIVKNRTDAGSDWCVYHAGNTSAPETDFLKLNTTEATSDTASIWNDTAPTSSVFTVGTSNGTNGSGDNYVAYCFAETEGYSKFGSYTGNGSTDGPFVYTGFRPAWIMFKATSRTGDWIIMDAKRTNEFNPTNGTLYANLTNAEATSIDRGDCVSNGYKLRNDSTAVNESGSTYIYMAFAENPLVGTNGIPVTAR